MSLDATHQAQLGELKCPTCGGLQEYSPETQSLKCQACGSTVTVQTTQVSPAQQENDFHQALAQSRTERTAIQVATVKCENCGATTALDANVASDRCAFCAAPLVVRSGSTRDLLRPQAVLPFSIDRDKALGQFKEWIASRWFAPNALKRAAREDGLAGVYVPYWTFDSDTYTRYTGMRGVYYYVSETYTAMENGKAVTRTRQVRKTRWYSASGSVNNHFDDILVLASSSLPEDYANKLEPWDLQALAPFDERYLSGFRTEIYQTELEPAFKKADARMRPTIEQSIRRDIGGDDQRINSTHVQHSNVTFKHVLLPIWISAYRFKDKVFRFLVNGRTAEVQGERPYSWVKITLFVMMILALVGAGLFVYNAYEKQHAQLDSRNHSPSSHGDDDLAAGVAFLEISDRSGNLSQAVASIDDGHELAGFDQLL